MIRHIARFARGSVVAAALPFVFAGAARVAGAQAASPDHRWDAWLGCWEPTGNPSAEVPLLCVTPLPLASAVEVATVSKGAVVSRDTIDAGGAARHVDAQGCSGTQRGEWSADARRVFLHADVTCGGGIHRTSNGILSIAPLGEWLDIETVSVSGNTAVHATHYRDATATRNDIPADLLAAATARRMAVNTGRTALGGALDVASIAEAVKRTDTLAVQAWIVERGARFTNLDAQQLVTLAEAGVPGSITDVMVGFSYPEHFALERQQLGGGSGYGLSALDSMRIAGDYLRDRCAFSSISIWSTLYDPTCDLGYRVRGYGGYYGYLYGSNYGYYGSPYLYSGYYSPFYAGFYSGPIVIVRGQEQPHGQVVKGHGYTCPSCATGSSGSSRAPGASTSTTGSSAGSSSGGSSSGGSSGGGSSGRTAHPRPPA